MSIPLIVVEFKDILSEITTCAGGIALTFADKVGKFSLPLLCN